MQPHHLRKIEELTQAVSALGLTFQNQFQQMTDDDVSGDVVAALAMKQASVQQDVDCLCNQMADLGLSIAEQISQIRSDLNDLVNQLGDAGGATAQNLAELRSDIDALTEQIGAVGGIAGQASSHADELNQKIADVGSANQLVASTLSDLHEQNVRQISDIGIGAQNNLNNLSMTLSSILGDDIAQVLESGTAAEDISAAELNAAAAGEFTKEFIVQLEDTGGKVLSLFNFEPTITPAESCTDADIGAPTITWTSDPGTTPRFNSGELRLTVTFDTDAGSTKTYQIGDSVTVTIDVTGITMCAGVADFVKTYDVIA